MHVRLSAVSTIASHAMRTLCVPLAILVSLVYSNPSTSRFPFLSLSTQGRPSGLNHATTAVDLGLQSIGSNPAFISTRPTKSPWTIGLSYNQLGVGQAQIIASPDSQLLGGTLAFHLLTVRYGKTDELDADGNKTGAKIEPFAFSPGATYAKVYKEWKLGSTIQLPNQYLGDFIESQWSWGISVDLGVAYSPQPNLEWAAALRNFGKEITPLVDNASTGTLPAELSTGIAYINPQLKNDRFSLDMHYPLDYETLFAFGWEHRIHPVFSVRGGGMISYSEVTGLFRQGIMQRSGDFPEDGNAQKVSLGFSITPTKWNIDYAVQYWHLLGLRHIVSVKVMEW